MDLVTTFSQFSHLVKSFRANKKTVWTNCFMLPDEIEKCIFSGRMTFLSNPDDLFFFVAERGHYRLLYYTSNALPAGETVSLLSMPGGEPLLLDLVARNGDVEQMDQLIKKKWNPVGFVNYKTYIRLLLRKPFSESVEPLGNTYTANEQEFIIGTGDPSMAEEIVQLWAQCLDPFSTSLPIREEVASFIAQGKVYYITDARHRLCAAMLMANQGQRATVQHVCVHPDYRRLGLGNVLMKASMRTAGYAGVHTYLLWVDAMNHPAIQLYMSLGFEPDGLTSRQLLFASHP